MFSNFNSGTIDESSFLECMITNSSYINYDSKIDTSIISLEIGC